MMGDKSIPLSVQSLDWGAEEVLATGGSYDVAARYDEDLGNSDGNELAPARGVITSDSRGAGGRVLLPTMLDSSSSEGSVGMVALARIPSLDDGEGGFNMHPPYDGNIYPLYQLEGGGYMHPTGEGKEGVDIHPPDGREGGGNMHPSDDGEGEVDMHPSDGADWLRDGGDTRDGAAASEEYLGQSLPIPHGRRGTAIPGHQVLDGKELLASILPAQKVAVGGSDFGTSSVDLSSPSETVLYERGVTGTGRAGPRAVERQSSTIRLVKEEELMVEACRVESGGPREDLFLTTDAKVRGALGIYSMKELRNLLQPIGRGGFGEVYRFQHHDCDMVVKEIRNAAAFRAAEVCNPLQIPRAVRDQNSMCYVNSLGVKDTSILLVMDYKGKPMMEAMPFEKTTPRKLLKLMRHILEQLAALHEHGKAHLDVKPLNITVEKKKDGSTRFTLVDFGAVDPLDRALSREDIEKRFTRFYLSPEVARFLISRDQRGSAQVMTPGAAYDLFGLGLTVLEAMNPMRDPVFWHNDKSSICAQIAEGNVPIPRDCPAKLRPVLERVLANDPLDRSSARQLLKLLPRA